MTLPKRGDTVRFTPHIFETLSIRTPEQAEAYRGTATVTDTWFPDPNDHSWCSVDVDGPFGIFLLTNFDVEVV